RVTPVIILDEIHMASNKLLEDLRIIFNFNMDSENPFILILAGLLSQKSDNCPYPSNYFILNIIVKA
ncbi:AAA family ATPase, partial [Syntrophomonas wolfei]|uniref:AAA family ATPase n=1 Tax=Syntrophomonas wolfei TaxID=863 RepID=UPI000AC66C27